MKDKRDTAKTANQDIMRWIREGGLFVIVCNLITVFKYILLQFLPAAFANMPKVDFGWPGIEVTMLGAPLNGTFWAMTQNMVVCLIFALI